MRGIDLGVADSEVLAAVDVDSVPVRVDDEVVDGADVAAGQEDGEMPAPDDGDVPEGDVPAALERDGLVARADAAAEGDALMLGVFPREAVPVYASEACDADVGLVLRPDQAVVKIRVSAVLVFRADERFARVVGVQFRRRRQEGCAL